MAAPEADLLRSRELEARRTPIRKAEVLIYSIVASRDNHIGYNKERRAEKL
jgi:hypothetical protein